MAKRQYKYLVGDFETTVYKNQDHTEVWASAVVELFTEDVQIFHSIDETWNYLEKLDENIIIYYHNLKFDGSFWLSYFLIDKGFQQAVEITGENVDDIRFIEPKHMKNKTFSYSISDMGQWYRILIKIHDHFIEIRDSLKLLPFSVKKIGKSFGTKHKKLEMEYTGFRYAGCEITDEEKQYISNDILVVKEALEIMFQEGHTKLTIGSCCLQEYKHLLGNKAYYETLFPNLYEIPIDENLYGSPTVGDYVHGSYKGGWCYLARGKENKLYHNGTTADVNSLYPSMMSSESGNIYPVGNPTFWKGDFIPDEALAQTSYYFIRIRTRFYIKPGYLPFVQVKHSLCYNPTEMLESSDITDIRTGKKFEEYIDLNGNLSSSALTLTLTMTDFILLKEHYELVDFQILDGCYFEGMIGIFDSYIEKYKKIKMESTGAVRELAKLFLNNLYGKMASSTDSSFKVAYVKDDMTLGFYIAVANDKEPGYIAVGSAITSYARNFTIRAAQANYYGPDKPGFIYADTDSIHCDLSPDELKGVKEDSKEFCCWKFESCWDTGFFVRQKTYIEHVTHENREPIESPFYNVKCAGMPDRCKDLFLKSMEGYQPQNDDDYEEEEIKFLRQKREITDFKVGLVVPGKLLPKRIQGGIVLMPTTYEMR